MLEEADGDDLYFGVIRGSEAHRGEILLERRLWPRSGDRPRVLRIAVQFELRTGQRVESAGFFGVAGGEPRGAVGEPLPLGELQLEARRLLDGFDGRGRLTGARADYDW